MGAWETDYATKTRIWSPEGMALFGIDPPDGQGEVGGPEDEFRAAFIRTTTTSCRSSMISRTGKTRLKRSTGSSVPTAPLGGCRGEARSWRAPPTGRRSASSALWLISPTARRLKITSSF